MNKIVKTIGIITLLLSLTYCKPDDNNTTIAVRDRAEVYTENLVEIENFLKSNSITVTEDGVSFETTDTDSPQAIWNQQIYPLQSVVLKNDTRTKQTGVYKYDLISDEVEYTVYYIIVNEGGGEHPITIDNVFTTFTTYNFSKQIVQQIPYGTWGNYPEMGLTSDNVSASAYRQMLTKIKTATGITEYEDGTYSFDNPGRIIVFAPSGLAYFNSTGSIPNLSSYQPVIFDITLASKREIDHDNDGLLSKYEDVNGNGDFWDDDTDNDGIPDFLDLDDDADGKTTREEITYETTDENGQTIQKLYNYDEIPNCPGGNIKKHLDPSCQ